MQNNKYNSMVAIALSLGALLMAPALHAADADAIIKVMVHDASTGDCTIKVVPAANAKCPGHGPQDICADNNAKLDFTSDPATNEFLIVPDQFKNPLRTDQGNGTCKIQSKNGKLKCKVVNPNSSGPADPAGYEFWVFAQGCSEPLDPRIFIR